MRNIFLEKSFTKWSGETIPRPFYRKLKLSKFYTVCFYCIPNWWLSKHIVIKMQTICFYLILSILKKMKRGLELVSLFTLTSYLIFCMIFEEKYLSCYILLIDQVPLSGCFSFVRYWAICVLQLFVNQVCDVMNFEINLNQAVFFYMTKKSW